MPGNHDYETPGAAPYFEYFGANAGLAGIGYYSFEIGAWHAVALNSNIPMGAGSSQAAWLRNDLAANRSRCVIACWHHPLFTFGPGGETTATRGSGGSSTMPARRSCSTLFPTRARGGR